MSDPIRLLVAGWDAPSGPAAASRDARLGVHLEALAAAGVEVVPWSEVRLQVPAPLEAQPGEAARRGLVTIDGDDIRLADAVLLRASDLAVAACADCQRLAFDDSQAALHAAATGHVTRSTVSAGMNLLLESLEASRAPLRNRALVFDLEAGLPCVDTTGVLGAAPVRRALRLADLTIVDGEGAAEAVAPFAAMTRVVRAGVDTAWGAVAATPVGPRRAPLRAAAVGRSADVRALTSTLGDLIERPVIWLSFDRDQPPETRHVEPSLAADEAPRAFRALDVDVLLAPTPAALASPELEWLNFALAEVPIVAARPIDPRCLPIRPGVDGLIADSADSWREAVVRLLDPAARSALTGAARRRAAGEYALERSDRELADAIRWAVEHADTARIARGALSSGDRAIAIEAAASEARATFEHSWWTRRRALEDRATLERLRGDRDVCWPEEDGVDPLVTIQIPTYDRGQMAVERAVRSALDQTYRNIEVLVVGDCAPEHAARAFEAVSDPRFRFVNLEERGRYPSDPEHRWMVAGAAPMNHTLAIARGAWLAPLDDDDEFPPDHVETLLSLAIENRLEFIYGQAACERADGRWVSVGQWPPRQGGIAHGAVLYSSRLRFLEYDNDAWRDEEPGDWCLWRRMIEAGVRMGFVEQVVFRHYMEGRHRDAPSPRPEPAPPASAARPSGADHGASRQTGRSPSAPPVSSAAGDICRDDAAGSSRQPTRLMLSSSEPLAPGWDRAELLVAGDGVVALPFPDASVDSIRAVDAMDGLDNVQRVAALAELRRVLTGGGLLELGLPSPSHAATTLEPVRAMAVLARLGFREIGIRQSAPGRADDEQLGGPTTNRTTNRLILEATA